MPPRDRIWQAVRLALAFGTPIVLFGLTIVYESRSLSASGNLTDAHLVGLISIVLTLVPLGLMIIGLIALIYVRNKSVGALLLGACVTFTVAAFASTESREALRISAFEGFVLRSAPLVQAIHAYEQACGCAPLHLERLTPEYLARLPTTEMGAFPDILYHVEVETLEQTTWGLEVVVSHSPPSRLLYRPHGNYSDLEGAQILVGDWIFEYQEFERGVGEESD